jgi:hypothetical protein
VIRLDDPTVVQAMHRVEGDEWLAIDKRGGPHSLHGLLVALGKHLTKREEWQMARFEPWLWEHECVVYGRDGYPRYVLRGPDGIELCLERSSTYAAKVEAAKVEGFQIVE